jgi:hypothetical protein
MSKKIFEYLGAASLAAILAAAPALAQDQSMSDLDTDQSGTVSQEEFTAGYDMDGSNIGASMDADESGDISEEEYAQGGADASERTGNEAWTEQDFGEADTDQSGTLSGEEISGLIFVVFDADQSGDLDEQEYQSYTQDDQAMGEGEDDM